MTHSNRPGPWALRTGALVAAASLLASATASSAAAPNPAQAACLLAVNKSVASIAKAEGKQVSGCVKAAAAGKLVEPTIEACIDGDAKGKVAKAHEKGRASIAKACTEAPPFGTTDLTGATASSAVAGVRKAVVKNLFGDSLDTAIAAKSADPAAASCQGALMKAIDKCWAARMSAYSGCVPESFTLPAPDAAAMGACRSSDPEGDVQAACVTAIQDTLDKKCAGVDLDTRLPGCECRYTQDCMQVAIANAENRMLTAAAVLPAADTVLPFVRTAQTPDQDPWISPLHGEIVASRIYGREEDAPLACPLGALNIYTIFDVQADIDYNNAIVPLIVDQGIRVLFSPRIASDVTGTSPSALVQERQAMPLYADAKDFLHLATRREMHDLAPLKSASVGTTMLFGQEQCLFNCDAIYAEVPPPNIVFGLNPRLLLIHFNLDRQSLENAVAGLAAEVEAPGDGITLRWVGRTVSDFKLELLDGSVVQGFNALPSDGSLIYELDAGVDPATEVLTLPNLSAFLAAATNEAVVLGE